MVEEGLTNYLVEEMSTCGLDMNNCRGQGYDNEVNMVGKKQKDSIKSTGTIPKSIFLIRGVVTLSI